MNPQELIYLEQGRRVDMQTLLQPKPYELRVKMFGLGPDWFYEQWQEFVGRPWKTEMLRRGYSR